MSVRSIGNGEKDLTNSSLSQLSKNIFPHFVVYNRLLSRSEGGIFNIKGECCMGVLYAMHFHLRLTGEPHEESLHMTIIGGV